MYRSLLKSLDGGEGKADLADGFVRLELLMTVERPHLR